MKRGEDNLRAMIARIVRRPRSVETTPRRTRIPRRTRERCNRVRTVQPSLFRDEDIFENIKNISSQTKEGENGNK